MSLASSQNKIQHSNSIIVLKVALKTINKTKKDICYLTVLYGTVIMYIYITQRMLNDFHICYFYPIYHQLEKYIFTGNNIMNSTNLQVIDVDKQCYM